jgi:hypothetical protein
MVDELLSLWFHWLGGTPCFRIYGKGRRERDWRVIHVYASQRHDEQSRWPLLRGSCVTWTSQVLIVGWDFARGVAREQAEAPASREYPVQVRGGRLHDWSRRRAAGASPQASASEILAHECGHTWQSLWIGPAYLPLVGSVTLFQEGPNSWNRFENEASEQGLFGGFVNGSVCPQLLQELLPARLRQEAMS